MKAESTVLARQRGTTWGERGLGDRHRPLIIFPVSIVVLTVLVGWYRLHSFAFGVRPLFRAHPKMEGAQLSTVFKSSYLGFNWLSLPRRQFSILRPPPLTIFSSANQNSLHICRWYVSIFNPDVHCYPSLDFPIRFSLFHICFFLFQRLMMDQ